MKPVRSKRFRSLAKRFSIVTTVVLLWVVTIGFVWDLNSHTLDWRKIVLLTVIVGGVALGISRFSIRVLGRPLELLEKGLTAVGEGKLELIQVSRTGDEIESLGESFNGMIRALAASQEQIRQHQELLEERIRERTGELERAMQGAMVASRAKSEFLANMSHELRTPMNGLLGMLDLVLDGPVEGEDRENIEVAQRCAYSLLGLLNDILDLSKIEAGRMQLERVPCNIRSVIEECLRPQAAKAQQKGVALKFSCASGGSLTVAGDPVRLRQIVNNLVSNAIKFTDAGSVTVTQTAVERPGKKVNVVIEVADTGSGIPGDKLALIFDKFTQADSSITRKYGGTGLGLAITQKLTELYGGSIRVESEVGKGSRFIVEIPFEVIAGEITPELPVKQAAAAASPRQAAHLLLVEDNPVNQRVALAMLRKKGYSIDVAHNGQEALEILEQATSPYDLVLMDVQMPILDGLETTRAIRRDSRWSHLPIVAMTAHAMTGDKERCLKAGMDAYLSKPLQAVDLIATIEQQLAAGTKQHPAAVSERHELPVPDDQELVRGMLQLFMHMAPERLRKLDTAVNQGDSALLAGEAKAIRVASKQLGNSRLGDSAARLESAASERDFALAARCANEIRQEIDSLTATPA